MPSIWHDRPFRLTRRGAHGDDRHEREESEAAHDERLLERRKKVNYG